MMTVTQKMTATPLPFIQGCHMTTTDSGQQLDLKNLIRPETTLEHFLLELPEFIEGLHFGKPRFGHPEGQVGIHVREVLDNIDALDIDPATRLDLRLVAIVHDAFKFLEVKSKAIGRRIHHAKIARDFVADKVDKPVLLDIIELHDEAFYIWRQLKLKGDADGAMPRLEKLFARLGENLPLYFLFFKCDTETGDKVLAPLHWFQATVFEMADLETREYIARAVCGF